jgi:hypothetical protein
MARVRRFETIDNRTSCLKKPSQATALTIGYAYKLV